MSNEVECFLEKVEEAAGSAAASAARMACAAAMLEEQAADSDEMEPLLPILSSHLATGEATPGKARRRAGAFYTPPQLVDFMLSRTLALWMADSPDRLPRVLDPSCGTGRFLLAAGRQLVAAHCRSTGASEVQAWQHIGPQLIGFDPDPLATAWLRGRITALAGGSTEAARGIHTIDALHDDALPAHTADIIVGNPPFGTPLRRRTDAEILRRRAAAILGSPIGPYADLAAVFLTLASQSLREGGHLALVQPLSVLAARDTQSIRDALLESFAPTFSWSTNAHIFDAQVHVCAVGFHACASAPVLPVRRFGDLPAAEHEACQPPQAGHPWSALAAPAFGVPDPPQFERAGTLGDIAHATADFRDQYYGLSPALGETPTPIPSGVVPVVTTGGLDLARCEWGARPMRLHKQSWNRPGVTLAALDPAMQQWATSRLVPKILLPTQTRILEPVLDTEGRWLPSVPIISVTADPHMLPHIAALLGCPLVSLLALHRHLGTARSPSAIKLAAQDVLALPMPCDSDSWNRAAGAFTEASHASDQRARLAHIRESAALMHNAFGVGAESSARLIDWWLARVR